MADEVISELGRAARGGAIALIGLLISAVFGFLVRALIGRAYGPTVYGAYNLAFTVFTIVLVVAIYGFPMGLQRQVSYFREKRPDKVGELVWTALGLVLVSSITGLVVIELSRGFLSTHLLSQLESRKVLMVLLGIIALALPPTALRVSLVSATQGFKRVREYFIYGRIFFPLTYFSVTAILILLGRDIRYIVAGYVISQILTFLLLYRDTRRFGILSDGFKFSFKLAKVLLAFSIPLMFSNIIGFVMGWTDTLMLGYYLGAKVTGVYNAAAPLARFLPVFLSAFTVIYSPIATSFYARKKLDQLNIFYSSIAKWILLLTFPLFFILVSVPGRIIELLFGPSYLGASLSLVILSLGYMFHSIVGPNGLTLVSIGKPKQEMIGNTIGAVMNVVLNLLLIPVYGMTGAAIATSSSYVLANLYKSLLLWEYGIKPFGGKYVRILVLAGGITIANLLLPPNLHLLAFVFGLALFFPAVLLVRGLERVDLELLKTAFRKFGINGDKLIKALEKYV